MGKTSRGKNKKYRKGRKKSKSTHGLINLLEEDASPEDIKKGNYTRVTKVTLDEDEPI